MTLAPSNGCILSCNEESCSSKGCCSQKVVVVKPAAVDDVESHSHSHLCGDDHDHDHGHSHHSVLSEIQEDNSIDDTVTANHSTAAVAVVSARLSKYENVPTVEEETASSKEDESTLDSETNEQIIAKDEEEMKVVMPLLNK